MHYKFFQPCSRHLPFERSAAKVPTWFSLRSSHSSNIAPNKMVIPLASVKPHGNLWPAHAVESACSPRASYCFLQAHRQVTACTNVAQQGHDIPFDFSDLRGLPLVFLGGTTCVESRELAGTRGCWPRPATNASRSETRTIRLRPIRKVATGNLPAESQFFAV